MPQVAYNAVISIDDPCSCKRMALQKKSAFMVFATSSPVCVNPLIKKDLWLHLQLQVSYCNVINACREDDLAR